MYPPDTQKYHVLLIEVLIVLEQIYILLFTGKGQNYEYHNVENQKERRKSCRQSLRQKDL